MWDQLELTNEKRNLKAMKLVVCGRLATIRDLSSSDLPICRSNFIIGSFFSRLVRDLRVTSVLAWTRIPFKITGRKDPLQLNKELER